MGAAGADGRWVVLGLLLFFLGKSPDTRPAVSLRFPFPVLDGGAGARAEAGAEAGAEAEAEAEAAGLILAFLGFDSCFDSSSDISGALGFG